MAFLPTQLRGLEFDRVGGAGVHGVGWRNGHYCAPKESGLCARHPPPRCAEGRRVPPLMWLAWRCVRACSKRPVRPLVVVLVLAAGFPASFDYEDDDEDDINRQTLEPPTKSRESGSPRGGGRFRGRIRSRCLGPSNGNNWFASRAGGIARCEICHRSATPLV